MNKFIDKLLINLLVSFTLFIILLLLKISLIKAIVLSSIIFSIILFITIVTLKKSTEKSINYRDFLIRIMIDKNEFITENNLKLVYKTCTYNQELDLYFISNYPVLFHNSFSAITPEKLISYYNKIKNLGHKTAYIMTMNKDKKSLFLNRYFNTTMIYISYKKLFKGLRKNNVLKSLKKTRTTFNSIKIVLALIFQKSNIKLYSFSSLILFLFSLITPLKVYYLSIASISLLLALVSLIYNYHDKDTALK